MDFLGNFEYLSTFEVLSPPGDQYHAPRCYVLSMLLVCVYLRKLHLFTNSNKRNTQEKFYSCNVYIGQNDYGPPCKQMKEREQLFCDFMWRLGIFF